MSYFEIFSLATLVGLSVFLMWEIIKLLTEDSWFRPGLPNLYQGSRLLMFLRLVRRAYEVETRGFDWDLQRPRGVWRGLLRVVRNLYPMFRITGREYWNTEVWGYNTLCPEGMHPVMSSGTLFSDGRPMRVWDYQFTTDLVDYCHGFECRWRGWVIPLECLWGNLLPDPTDAHAAKVTQDLEMDVF
jgi:hypothetical protein